jgi:hypothetical protein
MSSDNLKLYGPVDISFNEDGVAKRIESEHRKAFIDKLRVLGIDKKDGCYVFALRSGKGFTPWYVGQATKGFGQECMEDHKLHTYANVFARGIKGTPVMFFVCQPGTAKNVKLKTCDEVEKALIQYAKSKNPELMNKKNAKLPEWEIEGVIRPTRKPTNEEVGFAKMMGI